MDSEQIGVVQTEQALAQIKTLGESPDDNYRTYYEVFVYSFCDSDGDGIGDLYGVYDKLDYIASLGVDGIWFSPIYPSPNADYGYDIADYKSIAPEYGTLEEFKELLDAADAKRIIAECIENYNKTFANK